MSLATSCLTEEDVEKPDTFSPWCRVKNKLRRGEFRSGHWQKIPVVPAVRKIRCHHLYWDNSSYSHWMHSIKVTSQAISGCSYLSIGMHSWFSGFFCIIVPPNCRQKLTEKKIVKTIFHSGISASRTILRTKKICYSLTSTWLLGEASSHVAIQLLP